MSHSVSVNSPYTGVSLPNGHTYNGTVTVTLTDLEFAQISQHSFDSGVLTDLGAIQQIGGVTVTGTPSAGEEVIADTSSTAHWGAGGGGLSVGVGPPSGGSVGDYYLRTDTPGVASQRLYVAQVPPAIVFRASAFGIVQGYQAVAATIPAAVRVGDLMLAACLVDRSAVITPPSGWASIRSDLMAGGGFQQLFWKIAVIGDTGGAISPSFALSAGSYAVLGMVAYSGVSVSNPIQVHGGISNTGPTTTPVAPTVMATSTGMEIEFFGNNNSGPITPPNTSRLVANVPSGTYVGVAEQVVAAPGATSPIAASGPSAFYGIGVVVLNSVPVTGVTWVGIV